MKPVNLIPSEKRRIGRPTSSRTAIAYGVIAVLTLVLVTVSAAAYFDGKVQDRQAEADSLRAEIDIANQQVAQLSEFTSFQALRDARVATIDSLAKSRFDWERVMRELAIVLPKRVWLNNLTGTVAPGVTVPNAAGLAVRAGAPGPALEITGCARNQRTVARLIAAMQDIDGISQVFAPTSAKTNEEPAGESAVAVDPDPAADTGDDAGSTGDCTLRSSFATFELVAAFDQVVVPAADAAIAAPVDAATSPTPPTATSDQAPAPADEGAAATEEEGAPTEGEVAGATQAASQATSVVGGEG